MFVAKPKMIRISDRTTIGLRYIDILINVIL